jgi:ribosomal protein S7
MRVQNMVFQKINHNINIIYYFLMGFLEKKKKLNNSNNFLVFVNSNIKNGLKNKSISNFIFLLKNIKITLKKDPILVMSNGFNNLRLLVYIYKRKIGSKIVIIPTYWNSYKKLKKGFLIFYNQVSKRSEYFFKNKMLSEFNDVILNKGKSIKARNDLYLLAAENQFNLRYAINFGLEKERKLEIEKSSNLKQLNIIKLENQLDYNSSIKKIDSFLNFYENVKKNQNVKN